MTARRLTVWILLFDLTWAGVAFAASWTMRYGLVWNSSSRESLFALLPFFVATCVTWTFLSSSLKLDGFHGGWRLPAVVSNVFTALSCTMAIQLAFAYLARRYLSRLVLLYFGGLLLIGFIAIRSIAYMVLRAKCRQAGVWRVVVLGTGRLAHELADKFAHHPETLCSVAGLLLPQESSAEDMDFARANPHSVTLSTFSVADYLREQEIDEVILAFPHAANSEFRSIVDRCRECGIRISVVPQLYELYVTRPRLLDLDGLPVLQLREPHITSAYLAIKRLLDVLFASVIVVPAASILVPVGIYLLTRGRHFLRAELRCGENGKLFSLLRLDVERPLSHSSWFERALEASSLAELPQLWNVLRGEMSLVGPRPESPERVQNYSEWQHRRLRVRPGMTGLAQVHGLRDGSSSEDKTKLDLQYAMYRSVLLDLSLLLQTGWTLAMRLARIPRISHRNSDSIDHDHNPSSEEVLVNAHRSQSGTD